MRACYSALQYVHVLDCVLFVSARLVMTDEGGRATCQNIRNINTAWVKILDIDCISRKRERIKRVGKHRLERISSSLVFQDTIPFTYPRKTKVEFVQEIPKILINIREFPDRSFSHLGSSL